MLFHDVDFKNFPGLMYVKMIFQRFKFENRREAVKSNIVHNRCGWSNELEPVYNLES